MAHLSDDRGQMLLIGGLAIAVAFVALALILNSSVYIENVANRENVVVGEEGVTVYQDDVRRGVGRAVTAGNANGSSPADRKSDINEGVETLASALRDYHAERGRAVDVAVDSHSVGTRVFRPDEGEFTEPNGTDDDWTVGSNTRFRRFGMNVTRSNLSSGALADVFRIRIDDGSTARKVYVFKNTTGPDKTVVRTRNVDTGALSAPCVDATGSTTVINLTAGEVSGEHCEALDFFESVDPSYTLAFRNGGSTNVTGRYDFVVNESNPSPDYGSDGEITTRKVVYSTRVKAVYYAPDVKYVAKLRVAPGEPDA
ncbi:MAG: hypothetical protein ABEJ34_01715 [Haloferacaceae archaeon]